ncbi:unnamed protein product [Prunus armeniaca]|uniref:Metallothionein-like protein n=1 Tax=Prunus armeniaca TaxID=36596 RepID=A0A6J5VRQ8_PRUAR|nr:unnamed protein product [Prunus armeniaca]
MHENVLPPPPRLKSRISHDMFHLLLFLSAIWHWCMALGGTIKGSKWSARLAASFLSLISVISTKEQNGGYNHSRRCTNTTEATSGGGDHMTCSCGQHCGCNPCTCAKSVVSTKTGKAYCKCGEGCACVSCAA